MNNWKSVSSGPWLLCQSLDECQKICFKREEGDTEDLEVLLFASFLEVKYVTPFS